VVKAHAGTLAMSRAYVNRLPTMASTKDASRSRLWRFTLGFIYLSTVFIYLLQYKPL
jgi:hypothetical protein